MFPNPSPKCSRDAVGTTKVASYSPEYARTHGCRTNAVIRLSRITYGHGTREGKIVGRGRFTDFREDAGRWLLFGGSLALPFPRPFDATLFFSTH
jgi:hypothetical protein